MDSNHRPHAYQACALTRLSYRPFGLVSGCSSLGIMVTPRFLLGALWAAIDSVDSVLFAIPGKWWTRPGSNRRPPGCKPGALPAELRAHTNQPQAQRGGRFQSIATLSRRSHSPFDSWRLDLLDANQALSQLSYGPVTGHP